MLFWRHETEDGTFRIIQMARGWAVHLGSKRLDNPRPTAQSALDHLVFGALERVPEGVIVPNHAVPVHIRDWQLVLQQETAKMRSRRN